MPQHELDVNFDPNVLVENPIVVWVTKAVNEAAKHHRFIKRKGEDAIPYVNHLTETAELVARATNGDPVAVIAALLHDLTEDTPARDRWVRLKFGDAVADILKEVSHEDDTLSSEDKKRAQIAKFPKMSLRAKIIKMADKATNSVYDEMPEHWDLPKRRYNLEAAAAIFELGEGINPLLEKFCWEIHNESMLKLTRDEKRGRITAASKAPEPA